MAVAEHAALTVDRAASRRCDELSAENDELRAEALMERERRREAEEDAAQACRSEYEAALAASELRGEVSTLRDALRSAKTAGKDVAAMKMELETSLIEVEAARSRIEALMRAVEVTERARERAEENERNLRDIRVTIPTMLTDMQVEYGQEVERFRGAAIKNEGPVSSAIALLRDSAGAGVREAVALLEEFKRSVVQRTTIGVESYHKWINIVSNTAPAVLELCFDPDAPLEAAARRARNYLAVSRPGSGRELRVLLTELVRRVEELRDGTKSKLPPDFYHRTPRP